MSGNNPATSDQVHSTSGELEPGFLAELTRALLPYLGPYSITTVKRNSRNTRDADELIQLIAGHIDDPARRQLFVDSATRILADYRRAEPRPASPAKIASGNTTGDSSAATLRPATPMSAELIRRGEIALAQIIGPLAGVLVQRYARATDNSRDFFDRLAAHLRTPEERHSFFERVRADDSPARTSR